MPLSLLALCYNYAYTGMRGYRIGFYRWEVRQEDWDPGQRIRWEPEPVTRLTLRSPEINHQSYDQLTLNKGAKIIQGLPQGLNGKESTCNAGDVGDTGLIPGLGRSPGEANGNPLQYSCLENPMDVGAWWATVQGVAKSWTQLIHTHGIWLIMVWLTMVQKQYAFSRNHTSKFEFCSLPGAMICWPILLWCWAVAAPSHTITRVENQYIDNHSVFHFQYSGQSFIWDIQLFMIK